MFVCLFVCFGSFVSLGNCSLIWNRHHYQWRTIHHDLFSTLMAIEQWGFFNVPHLLWHGPTLYNDHLRCSVTLTPCRVFGSGALTTCLNNLNLSRPGIEHRSPACEANALPLRQCGGLFNKKTNVIDYMFVKYWFASMLQIRLRMIQNAFLIKDQIRLYMYNCCSVHSCYVQDPGITLHKI